MAWFTDSFYIHAARDDRRSHVSVSSFFSPHGAQEYSLEIDWTSAPIFINCCLKCYCQWFRAASRLCVPPITSQTKRLTEPSTFRRLTQKITGAVILFSSSWDFWGRRYINHPWQSVCSRRAVTRHAVLKVHNQMSSSRLSAARKAVEMHFQRARL